MINATTNQVPLTSEQLPTNIDAIKKAFIQQHQLPAANEQMVLPAATQEHVVRVKDWLQDLERELGVKAKVLASPVECGLTHSTPAALINDEAVLFANYIGHHKQAMDVFEYAVVGLLGVERLMAGSSLPLRLFEHLSEDVTEYLARKHDLDPQSPQDQALMVKLYLADLASLNVTLTWLERRDAWQRQYVRLLYPKLKYTSLDLHYLLLKARRNLKKG